MVQVRIKRNGLRIGQIWHNDSTDLAIKNVDIAEFKESYVPIGSLLQPFRNGILSFNKSLEEIYNHFDKGFKYEVRRADKEGVACEVSNEEKILEKAYQHYKRFCLLKNITAIPFVFLSMYERCDNLRVTVAKLDNLILRYHIYFVSDKEFTLLASFPAGDIDVKKGIVGFANRSLHWYDIKEAYSKRVNIYNLGGIGNHPSRDATSIVKFKMEMNPQTKEYYQGTIPVSMRGKFYLKLKHLLKRQ